MSAFSPFLAYVAVNGIELKPVAMAKRNSISKIIAIRIPFPPVIFPASP
jgi:hypothetical protein